MFYSDSWRLIPRQKNTRNCSGFFYAYMQENLRSLYYIFFLVLALALNRNVDHLTINAHSPMLAKVFVWSDKKHPTITLTIF